jgi:hypothetical protein
MGRKDNGAVLGSTVEESVSWKVAEAFQREFVSTNLGGSPPRAGKRRIRVRRESDCVLLGATIEKPSRTWEMPEAL